jgi:hypothetical protein
VSPEQRPKPSGGKVQAGEAVLHRAALAGVDAEQHLLDCDLREKRDRVRVVAWCSHRTEPIVDPEVADDAVRAAERIAPFGIVQRRDTDKPSL